MKAIRNEAGLGKPLRVIFVRLGISEVRVPATLSIREQEHIVKRCVGRVQVADSDQGTITTPEDYVARLRSGLIREDDSNFICSRQITSSRMNTGCRTKADRNITIGSITESRENLVGMEKHRCILVILPDDTLQGFHSVASQVRVVLHSVIKCCMRLIDVKLRVCRCMARGRYK